MPERLARLGLLAVVVLLLAGVWAGPVDANLRTAKLKLDIKGQQETATEVFYEDADAFCSQPREATASEGWSFSSQKPVRAKLADLGNDVRFSREVRLSGRGSVVNRSGLNQSLEPRSPCEQSTPDCGEREFSGLPIRVEATGTRRVVRFHVESRPPSGWPFVFQECKIGGWAFPSITDRRGALDTGRFLFGQVRKSALFGRRGAAIVKMRGTSTFSEPGLLAVNSVTNVAWTLRLRR